MDIDQFLNKKEDEISFTKIAKAYGESNNDPVIEQIGSGNFGFVFRTKNNKVIKVTKDPCEVYTAYKMLGKNLNNAVNIHDIKFIDDLHTVIKQDLAETNASIRGIYFSAEDKLRDSDQCIDSFDESTLKEFGVVMDEDEIKLVKDLQNGVNEIFNLGGVAYDVHEDNIGKNTNGDFVVFDQKDIHSDPLIYKEKVLKIKDSLKKRKSPRLN